MKNQNVKEIYAELKKMAGRAELVTELAIRNELGDEAFELLRANHMIELCRVDEFDRRWYAI